MLRGFTRHFPPLKILTDEQVQAIHRGILDVLQNTGMRVEHDLALKLFEKNDCKVDYEEKRVRFPPGLVEECLGRCPSSFRVKARDPKNDLILAGNTVYFTSYVGMEAVDLDTWEPRPATMKEQYDAVTVLDALDNMHWLWCFPYFGFEGVPAIMMIPESNAAGIRNSTKFMTQVGSTDTDIFNIQMAQALGTEVMVTVNSAPPLTIYEDQTDCAFRGAEAGMPMLLGTGVTFGATAPATIAGSLITTNAEMMAQIVLVQLVKPGTRVVVGTLSFPQNMKTGAPAFGQIGTSFHHVAYNQMWGRYEIPTTNVGVALSSSKKMDFQDGYERAISALFSALSGASGICLHGCIHGELSHHPLQAILDDDIAGMVGRFMKGVEVSDETMALDLIEQVGPIPGNYLSTAHTREWWKKEQFVPRAADTLTYPEWIKRGKKDCLDYAKERMDEILATHRVSIPLTPSQEEDIGRILNKARDYYRKKGKISDEEWEVYKEKVLRSPDYPFA